MSYHFDQYYNTKKMGFLEFDISKDTSKMISMVLLRKGHTLVHTKRFLVGFACDGIRSAKQDDIYRASNIVLPCPGS